jgi:hypothetical protein
MGKFFGKKYWYPTPNDGTREIGVAKVLGDLYAVCWITAEGARRRIKTYNLPVIPCPKTLQAILEEWATQRRLREVE